MAHQHEGEDGGDGGFGFLIGQALARIEERLDKLERTAAAVGVKLDVLIAGGAVDLTPEEKAAFEERLKRLEGLGTLQPQTS